MKKFLIFEAKMLATVMLAALAVVILTCISPIYRFSETGPFEGPDIFNPYAALDTTLGWKRANFHTHTKVNGPLNECDFLPIQVDSAYRTFGYDIVTFSNHNELTTHPYDASLQVNVYEHGYNLFKYHKLVFGCRRVNHFDNIIPLLTSQRQFQMDLLGRDADFIQLNHPFRTNCTTKSCMEHLTGYRITELDSGISTEQEYWDWSLSAGHYTFGLTGDDLHHPDRTDRIAIRCNMLNCADATYQTIKKTLLSGAYYSMRVPDFGDGDWEIKHKANETLPYIRTIGLSGDTVSMVLSSPAASIQAIGQDHTLLASVANRDSISYVIKTDDPYVRLTAFFDDGTVIYTNPFARYDSSAADTPYVETPHTTDYLLTILYNLLLIVMAAGCIQLLCIVCRRRQAKSDI